jgi:hypothetical protein
VKSKRLRLGGGACGIYGGEKKRMEGFGGNTSTKETTWKDKI